jgi:hypothetical protein
MISAWMWKLAMMVSTYDEEVVTVSVVEEDMDPGTSFFAVARMRRRAAAAFSSVALAAATRASSRYLGTLASVAGRATMSDDMRTKEEMDATRASSRYLGTSTSVAGRTTMSDDMTTEGEEDA